MPSIKSYVVQSPQHLVYLLAALCVFFVTLPVLPYLPGWAFLFRLGMSVVFIANLLAHRQNRLFFYTTLTLVIVAVLLTWLTMAVNASAVVFAYHMETAILLALTASCILITVISKHAASNTSIIGAMVVYLLFGLSWALMYSGIYHFDNTAFSIPQSDAVELAESRDVDETLESGFSLWVYFSFVTMSTLGYGDFTPLSPFAQTLAWIQSVAGQFYLAILVARLVSILPERERKQSS